MKIQLKMQNLRQGLTQLFDLLNSVNPKEEDKLTSTEIRVLVEFLLLPRKKFEYQRFSSVAKKRVIKSLQEHDGWTLSPENLNNKIYSMIEKKFLRRDEDQVIYLAKHIKTLAFKLVDNFEAEENFLFALELIPNVENIANLETEPASETLLRPDSGNYRETYDSGSGSGGSSI
jgi:hypothetical protein